MGILTDRLRGSAPLLLGLLAGLFSTAALEMNLRAALTAAPALSLTTVREGMVVGGVVTLAATSDAPGLERVRFQVSGRDVGSEIRAGACLVLWDTTNLPDGSYTVQAFGRDASGAVATSPPVMVTVNNALPDISDVQVSQVGSTTALVTWTTNLTSDSQVEYGTTTEYGRSTPVNPQFVTSHAEWVSGLTPGTRYYFRVRSTNWRGAVNVSGGQSFMTASGGAETPPPREEPRTEVPLGVSVELAVRQSRVDYTLTAIVRREGKPVPGALVHIVLVGPEGSRTIAVSRTSDENGVATLIYPRTDWVSGPHRVDALIEREGGRAAASTTFTVR